MSLLLKVKRKFQGRWLGMGGARWPTKQGRSIFLVLLSSAKTSHTRCLKQKLHLGCPPKFAWGQLLCGCRIMRSNLFRENDVLLQSREAVHPHVIDSKADSFHERDYVPFRGMKKP